MRWLAPLLFASISIAGCASAHGAPATLPSNPVPPTTQPTEASIAAEYIEYRYHPELGSITIQSGIVRGQKRVASFEKRAKDLPKRGIFPMLGKSGRKAYLRREKIDGRKIDTVVVIDPPTQDQAGPPDPNAIPKDSDPAPADNWTAHVLVRVDGRVKVACTIGNSADSELWIHSVTIYPEDGTIDLVAISSDGQELSLPTEWLSLDDPTIITDGSFFEDDPAADDRAPVKV